MARYLPAKIDKASIYTNSVHLERVRVMDLCMRRVRLSKRLM